MSDEQARSQQDVEENEGKVSLDVETYTALLERLDYLETIAKGHKPRGQQGGEDDEDDDDIDNLAREGSRKGKGQEQPPDFESLSQTELVKYLEQGFVGQYIQPLLQKVYQIDFQLQIDRLTQQDEYKDFHDYDEEIYAVLKKNPNMNLEDAYHLAKKRTGSKTKEGEERASSDALRHLPKVPKRTQPLGERPGTAASATRAQTNNVSTKEAAALAYDEVFQKK